ncbi:hypothetical protein B0H16DRAFT_1480914 [Mycena metata]|uniref:Uncharacterized protein n=1 Tax=Mycena metata TaxID=1033252 RepID=A0AAD7H0Y0_9AGAR|nr:hypothetical protein B0H16DRAFT_1480914 [Mycena metata]
MLTLSLSFSWRQHPSMIPTPRVNFLSERTTSNISDFEVGPELHQLRDVANEFERSIPGQRSPNTFEASTYDLKDLPRRLDVKVELKLQTRFGAYRKKSNEAKYQRFRKSTVAQPPMHGGTETLAESRSPKHSLQEDIQVLGRGGGCWTVFRDIGLVCRRGTRAEKVSKSNGKRVKESEGYRPGLSKEEKAARHRKAQREYRARCPFSLANVGPGIRNFAKSSACTLQKSESNIPPSAAIRAHRRRRAPPKPPKQADGGSRPVERGDEAQHADDNCSLLPSDLTFQDFRAPSYITFASLPRGESEEPLLGTAGSPSPDELIACDALADLAHGGPRVDTAADQAGVGVAQSVSNVTESLRLSARSFIGVAALIEPMETSLIQLPRGVTPATPAQLVSLHTTGSFGLLSHVQSAQMRVALMNREPPRPSTSEERSQWAIFPPGEFDRSGAMAYGRYTAVDSWRLWANVAMLLFSEEELDPVSQHLFNLSEFLPEVGRA